MKYFLIIALIIVSFNASAQKDSASRAQMQHELGYELAKFHKKSSIGYGLLMVGTGVNLLLLGNTTDEATALRVVSGVTGIVGGILVITASRHISNAGTIAMYLVAGKQTRKQQKAYGTKHF